MKSGQIALRVTLPGFEGGTLKILVVTLLQSGVASGIKFA